MMGGKRSSKRLRAHAQHVELAAGQAVLRQAVGVQGREVVARADDDRLGLDRARGWSRASARRRGVDDGLAPKRGHLRSRSAEPGGELGDRLARFDPRLVRAIERAGEFVRPQT